MGAEHALTGESFHHRWLIVHYGRTISDYIITVRSLAISQNGSVSYLETASFVVAGNK